MRFCVLGSVEMAAAGRRAAGGSERQRTIMAVLLAAGGEVVSAHRLIDGLWVARPPPSAKKSLQSHVSRLRRTLASIEDGAGEVLLTAVDGYRVDLTACELDATHFEGLVAQARGVLRTDPHEAAELLDEAHGLWRGPAFGELADHEQVRAEARRLEQLREVAAADRVEARLALGRHEQVLGELEAAVAADPLAERAHAQLMVALCRAGHQAEALATYRRLQQRRRDEVGIDPSTEVQELHERILRQDDGLALPPARWTSERPRVARSARSPSEPTATAARPTLIGRGADVAAVGAFVTTTRLVTLVGTGGVGKTRLAEQAAAVGPSGSTTVWRCARWMPCAILTACVQR